MARPIRQLTALWQRVLELLDRARDLRVMRGMARYSMGNGGMLAGGTAYSALFSIAAALTIAWTAFMASLGNHRELRDQVIASVNSVLPNLLDDGSGNGMIDPKSLVLSSAINPASLIAAGVLLWSAISMLSSLAGSIRTMFGLAISTENTVFAYVRALSGFVVMALGILISSILTIGASSAGDAVMRWLDISDGIVNTAVRISTIVGSLCVDALVVAFLVRVVAIVHVPFKDLAVGSCLAAAFLTIIRILGTSAVGSVTHNKLLVSFAAIATLLLWLNLSARILLMSCAFMANPPRNMQLRDGSDIHANDTPNYVTLSAPATLEWAHNPATGYLIPESIGEDECPSTPSSQQGA
ncbi:MAG: YihY/virulence factor BrkB family protein [Ancrocorticia sp.]|nr:YihY/virulence factor BrkB family protein [Ancrocorticia sp.]